MNVWETSNYLLASQPAPEGGYFERVHRFALDWKRGKREFSIQTSGSTGPPKTIVVRREQMAHSARMTREALNLNPGTRALHCLNVQYIAGMMMVVRALEFDWHLTVIEPAGDPLRPEVLGRSTDFVALVPYQLSTALAEEGRADVLNKIGTILLGGSPVSFSLQQSIQRLKVPVYHSYGMTETVSHIALRRLNGPNPIPDYQVMPSVRIGTDERGCLHATGEVTNGVRVQTNDLVRLTSASSFEWLGRFDSVINSGGVKIQLDKLDRIAEKVLYGLGMRTDFFHWYFEDERLGQMLVLFLESGKAPVPTEAIRAGMGTFASAYELPREIIAVDAFRKTASGKIDRAATTQHYLSQNER